MLLFCQVVDLLRDRGQGLPRSQSVRTHTESAFADQPLEARHPHHEEFIEIGAEDGRKLHPLEQWNGFVLRFLEQAPIELKPGELTIDVCA